MGIVYRLEYVHLEEKDKRVVRLMIDSQEYIDEAEARRDFIRSEEAGAICGCFSARPRWALGAPPSRMHC